MPLINDLRLIWDEGIMVFDAYCKKSFQLHALFFHIINDFLVHENLPR